MYYNDEVDSWQCQNIIAVEEKKGMSIYYNERYIDSCLRQNSTTATICDCRQLVPMITQSWNFNGLIIVCKYGVY